MKKKAFSLQSLIFLFLYLSCFADKPRLSVIFVVDQMAYFYLPQLASYFTSGLKTLMKKGVNYTSAYFPHGMPSTATGHAGLGTGTYAKDHGIIGNGWYNERCEYLHCDDDSDPTSLVFSPTGTYSYGKSARNIMVGGVADKYMAYTPKNKPHHVYSVSLKSRAAIFTAGRLGKAFWFDNRTGYFTSSKAYYSALPAWFNKFNANQTYREDKNLVWDPVYDNENKKAYSAVNDLTYQYARYDFKLVGKNISPILRKEEERPYDLWIKSPFANQAVLDLGRAAIDEHIRKDNSDEMMLWVCLSSLDKVGHFYGPNSKEVIDLIYHLDRQLGEFMEYINKKIGEKNALYVLTADHGIMPFVEILNARGEQTARRIPIRGLIQKLNDKLEKDFGLKEFVTQFKVPQFYVDRLQLKKLDEKTKKKVFDKIKQEILKHPGVKKVWTASELEADSYEPDEIENYFKLQMYPGRSGDIIVQTFPNNVLTSAKKGTSHKNPYEDNTHVPLILYQPGQLENKRITERVWTLQLANTLSEILHIPKATASTFDVLPELFENKGLK